MARLLPALLLPFAASAADPAPGDLLDENTFATVTVVAGEVTAGPGREVGDVVRQMRQKEPYLTTCLARAVDGGRTVHEGQILVAFQVTPAGTVLDAVLAKDEVGNDTLSTCVLSQVRGTSFGFSVSPRSSPVVLALQVARPFARDTPAARPVVSFGEPRIVGRMEPDLLPPALDRLVPTLEGCHIRSLEEGRSARSETEVRFLVDRTGSVSGVMASATGDPWLTECTRKAFETLRLPASATPGRTVVRQPVRFDQAASEPAGDHQPGEADTQRDPRTRTRGVTP